MIARDYDIEKIGGMLHELGQTSAGTYQFDHKVIDVLEGLFSLIRREIRQREESHNAQRNHLDTMERKFDR